MLVGLWLSTHSEESDDELDEGVAAVSGLLFASLNLAYSSSSSDE